MRVRSEVERANSRQMIWALRPSLLILAMFLLACQTPEATSLPISRHDHTTRWYGDDTDYGPRAHFVHVVRDTRGQMKEIYRYYFDAQGRPVLDGLREIRRSEGDRGLLIE